MVKKERYDYEYLNRIKEHYHVYTKSARKIADFFMENSLPEDAAKIVAMSIAQLADATGTSPASIIRFCHALGFNGLAELKYYINKGILSPNFYNSPLVADDSISIVRQKIGNMTKNAIDDTIALLDDNSLTLAVDKLAGARRILMLAEGGSGCTAKLAELMFIQLGLECRFIEDGFVQMLQLDQLSSDDVVFAITHSGRAANTIKAIEFAKGKNIPVIGITSIVNSPLTKSCDIILFNSSMEQEYFSNTSVARICELSVISILHSALLQRTGDGLSTEQRVHQLYEMKRIKV